MIVKSLQALLLTLLAALMTGTSTRPATSLQSEKQKAAENAADRVMKRCYETLDFGVIYREMYVSDPLRTKEVCTSLRVARQEPNGVSKEPTFDFAALERAYIAYRNFQFLASARHFTYDGDEDGFRKELEVQLKQYFMPMMTPPNPPVLTSEQLDARFTSNFNQLSDFLRKYVVSKNFDGSLYRKRIAFFKESRPPEKGLPILAGLKQKVYVVQRERLHLYFVEENGEFRMLTVTPRVMD